MASQRNDFSPLRRFATAARHFGLGVAVRVAYSKVRGRLFPAKALPDAPVWRQAPRELSILFCAAEQDAVTLEAAVQVIAERSGSDWELCVWARSPIGPPFERALTRLRGASPRIRVVSTDPSVDEATAARWTVEQATGEFVALLAPGYLVDADAIVRILDRLRGDQRIEAAILVEPIGSAAQPHGDCRLLAQRKSRYLATAWRHWPLTAPILARTLQEMGAPIAIVAPRRKD